MNREEREAQLKDRLDAMLAYERALWDGGVLFLGGVDEVGRGPLAGPVCAACVVLPRDFSVLGVNDSKKISEKKRSELYGQIIEQALAYGIGLIGPARIDEVNILNATKEAMLIAIGDANRMLAERLAEPDGTESDNIEPGGAESGGAEQNQLPVIGHLLVDAVKLPEARIPGTAIVKGDEKSVSIAAASIVAKVTRDRIMMEFENIYPGYGFAKNKGYGTAEHYAGLEAHGMTPIHRQSFCRSL